MSVIPGDPLNESKEVHNAWSLYHQGVSLQHSLSPVEGLGPLKEAREAFEALGHKVGYATATRGLADCLLDLSREVEALPYAEEAVELFSQLQADGELAPGEERQSLGDTYRLKAQLHERVRDFVSAADFYQRAVDFFRAENNRIKVANNLRGLAHALTRRELRPEARACLVEAIGIYRFAGEDRFAPVIGECTYLLGTSHLQEGNHLKAQAAYESAYEIFLRTGHRGNQAQTLEAMGNTAYFMQDDDRAAELYYQAAWLFNEEGRITLRERAMANYYQVLELMKKKES